MSTSAESSDPREDRPAPRTRWGRTFAGAAIMAAVVAVILLAFSWPSVTSEPKDLPIAVSGTDDAVSRVAEAIDANADGAITLVRTADRAAAVDAIRQREVYGAIVLGDAPTDAPEVVIASAANASVAQILTALGAKLQTQIDQQVSAQLQSALKQAGAALQALASGAAPPTGAPPAAGAQVPQITVAVTDVVPFADRDPRGSGLAVSMFPLVLGGMIGGIGLTFLVVGAVRRFVAVIAYSAVAGVLLTGVLQGWYGALQGSFGLNTAAISLALLAIAAPITGLITLIGRAGIAVGAVTFVLIANPISAATVPLEFLPAPWGAVGQWFPPGAAATLLRDLSYFPDAPTLFPWLVLLGWAVAGLLLTLLGHVRGRRAAAGAIRTADVDEGVRTAPAPAPVG